MRPIDADALNQSIKESFDLSNIAYEETTDAFEKEIYKMQLMVFAECGCRVKEAPTLTLDDLLPKERAMWIPYYNGGLDRREYRCSKCWNRTPNNQDPRCLDCGSEMLREM